MSEERGSSSTAEHEDIFESSEPGATPVVVRATDLTGVHVLKHDNLFMLANAYGDNVAIESESVFIGFVVTHV